MLALRGRADAFEPAPAALSASSFSSMWLWPGTQWKRTEHGPCKMFARSERVAARAGAQLAPRFQPRVRACMVALLSLKMWKAPLPPCCLNMSSAMPIATSSPVLLSASPRAAVCASAGVRVPFFCSVRQYARPAPAGPGFGLAEPSVNAKGVPGGSELIIRLTT